MEIWKYLLIQIPNLANPNTYLSVTLLASSSCRATVRKTWRKDDGVRLIKSGFWILHGCDSVFEYLAKRTVQTCAVNAKKLRMSKSCLQKFSFDQMDFLFLKWGCIWRSLKSREQSSKYIITGSLFILS